MGSTLPDLKESRFRELLGELSTVSLSEASLRSLYTHYTELKRWSAHTSLVGPGTAELVLERHYGESLAALPLLTSEDRILLDIGSGAGFPGWVLAAARPDLQVYLVEPKSKKIAFLKSATLKSGLSCRCLDARVGPQLPQDLPGQVDIVTCRALKVSAAHWALMARRYPATRLLLWQGAAEPDLPTGMKIQNAVLIPGSHSRRILEISSGSDRAQNA